MSVQTIPAGYASVTPYLMVPEAAKAIEFYQQVFGSKERMRMPVPGGRIAHAEIEVGGSVIMLADCCPESGSIGKSPLALGGTPVMIHLYVKEVDAVFAKALAAGAAQIRPVADQFYGDRSGLFADPFGHVWNVATHVEDVTPEEMQRRMAAMAK